MIKLILDPYFRATSYEYSFKRVTIGGKECDLLLEFCFLDQPVEICEEEDDYILCNPARDPSVTLNGQFAVRERLFPGDRIHIGETEILFAGGSVKKTAHAEDSSDSELDRLIDETENELISLSDDEVDSLLQELELLEQTPQPEKETPIKFVPPSAASVYKPVLREETPLPVKPSAKPRLDKSKRLLVLSLALILFLVGGGAYLKNFHLKSEILAARGLADISLALTHAKMTQSPLTPQKLFKTGKIEEHIAAVLSESFRQLSPLDPHGRLLNPSYTLSIYSTREGSRFLLFALPKDTFLQKLFPLNTYLIDSTAMEIRATKNLLPWADLLQGHEDLDSFTPQEISSLLKQASLVSIAFLEGDDTMQGFSPPLLLDEKLSRRLYNAPRYFSLTQPLFEKAMLLDTTNPGDLQQIADFLHTLNTYSFLPDLIVYSPGGLDGASTVYQHFKRFAPQHHFLLAYLDLDPKNGQILDKGFVTQQELSQNDFMQPSLVGSLLAANHPQESEEQALLQTVEELTETLNSRQQLWERLLDSEQKLCDIPYQILTTALNESDSPLMRFKTNGQRLQEIFEDGKIEEESKGYPLRQKLLEAMIHAQALQSDCLFLQKELVNYIERLNHWLEDLKQAKEEGFYISDRAHHLALISLAERRLKKAAKQTPALEQLAERLYQASADQERLAVQGLHELDASPFLPQELLAESYQQLYFSTLAPYLSEEMEKIKLNF